MLIVSLVVAPYPVAGGGGSANEVVYRWVLADRLGSALTEVDVEGEILRQARFKPFGGLDHEVQLSSPSERRRLYAGHAEQEETGFFYMQARWMDPETGTFLSVDPVVPSAGDPQSFNAYAYARNNPVSNIDPTGMAHFECYGNCYAGMPGAPPGWLPNNYSWATLSNASAPSLGSVTKLLPTSTALRAAGNVLGFDGGTASLNGQNLGFDSAGALSFAGAAGGSQQSGGTQVAQDGNSPPFAVSAKAQGKDVVITYSDGSTETRSGGTRAWRNNNPGNLRNYAFSKNHGSIGAAGGFAVFPNEATGQSALESLLRTSTYQGLSLNDAIARFAPPIENNTAAYQGMIRSFTGLPGSTLVSTLNSTQLTGLAGAIRRIEGWTPGTVR